MSIFKTLKKKIKECCIFMNNWMRVRPILIMRLLRNKNYYDAPSYFPEMKRKLKATIIGEQIRHILKYCYIEEFYFAYGLDIKKFRKASDYVDYGVFMKCRDRLNKPSDKPFNYTGILRDKFYFNLFATSLNFPTSSNLGFISGRKIFVLEDKKYMDIQEYFQQNKINAFCKAIDAEDGKGIYAVTNENGEFLVNDQKTKYEDFSELLSGSKWTIEKKIIQHPTFAAFYPKSVNTLRIYTVRDMQTQKIVFLPSIFRVGANNNNVDNWARGGLIIRLFEDGKLGKYGFYRPKYGTKVTEHPDSHIIFENFELPYVKEAFQMVQELHSFLYGVHSIGWDVAITANGPIIIEANDNWEISATQIPSYGLQHEFEKLFCYKN